MSITPDQFNNVMDEWKEWQSLPWGRLFYSISHHNLQPHLPGQALRILDVGGGNGMDSIYYASLGHRVVLLDYSPAMLADAKKRAEAQGVADKITFVEADAQQVQAVLSRQNLLRQPFDLILCNLMLEFVPDPPALLRDIAGLLGPGGLLSLIDGNRYCEAFRTALFQNDLTAALNAVGTTEYPHRWFNRSVPTYSAEEMIQMLQGHGCEPVDQYGILCVTQYLPNERKYEPEYYAELERLEFCLSATYPYYLLARFYQVVMRKKAGPLGPGDL